VAAPNANEEVKQQELLFIAGGVPL